MLSFKELRDLTEAKEKPATKPSLLPPVLIFTRKAIRVLPDGQQISSYYSDQLSKHVIFPITF
jgi:hypothetical protein